MKTNRIPLTSIICVFSVFTFIIQILILLHSNSYAVYKCSTWINSEKVTDSRYQQRAYNLVSYKDYLNKPSSDLTKLHSAWRKEATLFQRVPEQKRYLTIGIPTVRRVGDEYIMKTIKSIVNFTRTKELKEIYIVIFLADFNETWRADISGRIKKSYSNLITSGTLIVIRSWESFYPPLDNLKHTYNDNDDKRKWRSKQNVDYAFIFLYSQNLSTYYIQMEDDIFTVPGYLQVIKDYVSEFKTPWTCLEFSELGFIGKLYHSYDLEKLAKMVLLFYEEQPCDFTFLYFNLQMLQFTRYIRRPTIFQHVGIRSSLPGKIQPLKDRYFDNLDKSYKGDNPPAKIYTNMDIEPSFTPEMAYSREPGYFWSKGNGKADDWFIVVFDEPQRVDSIIIDTGSREHPEDKIEHGKLQASLSLVSVSSSQPKCTNDILLGYFENGDIKVGNLTSTLGPFKIHCVSIILTETQSWWIIIKEIAIFVAM
ncbi:alpha-1,3-mannosyl-glycoprotein 4-beta-N-acetylglucosaminyltransferase C-like [Saccostrea cucullata]|uniref:alpha-1,3-mannosyl-glycoprotein 4-beta-N-acetylglucosaminyltransferase C-like n=1 Tax=Saccostrea cuccullata TaxID=36930 RepID=UPI002ED0F1B9